MTTRFPTVLAILTVALACTLHLRDGADSAASLAAIDASETALHETALQTSNAANDAPLFSAEPNNRSSTQPAIDGTPSKNAGVSEPADALELRANMDAQITALDDRFMAEPHDHAWANAQQHRFDRFFDHDALASEGLTAPLRMQATCHSATCRLSASYADAQAAEQATQHLAMHLADRLPYGAVMPRLMQDGSIEVNAWYSSKRFDR